jgi:hypothetical protein
VNIHKKDTFVFMGNSQLLANPFCERALNFWSYAHSRLLDKNTKPSPLNFITYEKDNVLGFKYFVVIGVGISGGIKYNM